MIFETASAFLDSCAFELNNTDITTHRACTKVPCKAVQCGISPIQLTPSLLFSTIVALVEVEVDRQHVLIVDFHEFQGIEARNEVSFAKIYVERRCTEADMVVAYHVGGRLGYGLWSSGWVEMRLGRVFKWLITCDGKTP